MQTGGRQGLLVNVVVGIAGAVLGGWLFSGFSGAWVINAADLSVGALLASLLGAAILLAIARLARVTG